ncbi:MAG TPA: hypothetical protein VNN74_07930 [Candidatus Micrarchaeia archaeon]|nr:hypothetical protein [Candidatus Micrarchaeia archaeon]
MGLGSPAADEPDDPNQSRGGRYRRVGPFWIEEPAWFWALSALVLLLGALALTLAILHDPP